jgi:hypothetical protein
VKIALQEKKEREEEESKISTKVAEEEEAAKNEFDYSLTESSKGGNESAFSPDQSEDKSSGSVYLCYVIPSSHVYEAHLIILCLNIFV